MAVVALGACTVYGEHPVKTFADATGGAGFEQGFWRDIQAQNWTDLDQHIAANFVYVTPTGRLERAAALDEFKKMRVTDYSLGDLTTEMNGDTFVVTYAITLRGNSGSSGGFPDRAERRMTVWQKEKAGWVAIAHSVLGSS
jgi:Domain of unknown function (DUF4440)